MSQIDVYVHRVLEHVPAALPQRSRIESDLRSHLAESVEAGRTEAEAVRRMGAPEEVARSFLAEVPLAWAPLPRRTLAFLVDMGVGVGVTALVAGFWAALVGGLGALSFVGGSWTGWTRGEALGMLESWGEPVTALILTAVALTFTVASFLYFPVLEHLWGQTLGKWLTGIAVVKETGERVGFGAAVLRRLPLLFNFFLLDAAFAPFTEKKQRAFDMVAKTVVVDVRDRGR
jgi:uncharacterized RDD family membrane protein YckC